MRSISVGYFTALNLSYNRLKEVGLLVGNGFEVETVHYFV
jgi:hypothetical protein